MSRTQSRRRRSGPPLLLGADEVAGLIEARQAERDAELRRLDEETAALRARLEAVADAKLREELACFKDVLELHRRARLER